MKTVWVNYDGDRFDSYEEAYDDAREKMEPLNFAEHFENYVDYEQLLNWALRQDNFWMEFEDAACQAEQDYFEEWYHEEEVEDEEDDN